MADHFDAPCRDSPGQELLRAGKDRFRRGLPKVRAGLALARGVRTLSPKYFVRGVHFAYRKTNSGSEAGGKLQLRVNADQRTARWRSRTEIADETVPGAELDMTGGAVGAVHEHRTDRRGEWIRHR